MDNMKEYQEKTQMEPAQGPETHQIAVGITPRMFSGLAKQNLNCAQSIRELVDNAIAARLADMKAIVWISMAPTRDKNYIWLVIADWGVGMDLAGLENALQLGSIPTGEDRLNEHGFGIDNALASLASAGSWTLYTHKQTGKYWKVSGPLKTVMTVREVADIELPEGCFLQWNNPSTVYVLRVPLTMMQTLQNRGGKCTDIVTLRSWLVEHLGVAYRGYLDLDPETMEPDAKIIVAAGKDYIAVPPIHVPMQVVETQRFKVELGGQVVPVEYKYGVLDLDRRDHLVHGKKAKYYYQENIKTQGIDIRLGKRVIATGQLEQIWQTESGHPLTRHNRFNDFVGEILIPELPRGVLSTLNNKSGIDPQDQDWQKLFAAISDFEPLANAQADGERALQKKWMDMLKAVNPDHIITDEVSVWPTGARIDVLDMVNDGPMMIYELKTKKGEPLNLYQMVMYWDGLVHCGNQPTEATLIVSSYSSDLAQMAQQINESHTPPRFPDGSASKPYCLKIATFADKHLE